MHPSYRLTRPAKLTINNGSESRLNVVVDNDDPHSFESATSYTTVNYVPPSPSRTPLIAPRSRSRSPGPERLYDLPSPPTSPPPVSPTFTSGSRRASRERHKLVQAEATKEDLEIFAEHCRKWYFEQHAPSSAAITTTLASLPPSHKAAYSRIQARVRAAYHSEVKRRVRAEFLAHLSSTRVGGSLSAANRIGVSGSTLKSGKCDTGGRKERKEKFERFVRAWCTMGMPGPEPFFLALYALMHLQHTEAGSRRIEWGLDDAVFVESAGKDFMFEAIDLLKGVLGFEERISPESLSRTPSLAAMEHSRSLSQPLDRSQPLDAEEQPMFKRPRAPSDPFLDTPSTITTNTTLIGTSYDEDEELPLRIWLAPDLMNEEWKDLESCIPSWVYRGKIIPSFPSSRRESNRKPLDLEEGLAEEEDSRIRFGTGTMWLSVHVRAKGYNKGANRNWWHRFTQWIKALCGLS